MVAGNILTRSCAAPHIRLVLSILWGHAYVNRPTCPESLTAPPLTHLKLDDVLLLSHTERDDDISPLVLQP